MLNNEENVSSGWITPCLKKFSRGGICGRDHVTIKKHECPGENKVGRDARSGVNTP